MKNFIISVFLLSPLLAMAHQTPVPMEFYPAFNPPTTESSLPADQTIHNIVIAAAARNAFSVIADADHCVTLHYEKTDWHLDITAKYDDKSIKLDYKDSAGIDYHLDEAGVAYINPNYNKRMQKFIISIMGKSWIPQASAATPTRSRLHD